MSGAPLAENGVCLVHHRLILQSTQTGIGSTTWEEQDGKLVYNYVALGHIDTPHGYILWKPYAYIYYLNDTGLGCA